GGRAGASRPAAPRNLASAGACWHNVPAATNEEPWEAPRARPVPPDRETSAVSTAPPFPRHALGPPARRIPALLAFRVPRHLWVVVLRPGKDPGPLDKEASLAFIYLQFLMVLILGHFFTAHGRNIGSRVSQRSPLGLPTGSVRLLLLAGYLGMAYYLWKTQVK